MGPQNLHFTRDEYAERQEKTRKAMLDQGLDGMLLFKIEDMYWLCGLDTDGFSIFHAMFIGTNDELTHVSRGADLANVRYSSVCDEIRIWVDAEGNPKSKAIKDTLASHRMQGKTLGIQLDTMGLTPRLYEEIRAALDGWCELVDASDLIRTLRLGKSPQELEYHRRAGAIVDMMRDVAISDTRAGVDEGDVMGKIWGTAMANDGDPPAHRPPMGTGASALNMRYTTRRKPVGENDQMTFELGAGYRHYHAADMFVVLTGPTIDPRHLKMHEACVDALQAIQDALRPGNAVGDLYEAHRAAFASHGYEHAAGTACGYTMGATWPPTWMEQPQIFANNSVMLEANMTFFTHMILIDHDAGLTMSLGEQAIVTEGQPEIITHVPRTPVIAR
ncbi:MAG: Xaa-Pro peptidase family protein [Actinomycetota bacterium]|nr:Xaa-Pro peptidase family protein [Actinomycetota bacterium]